MSQSVAVLPHQITYASYDGEEGKLAFRDINELAPLVQFLLCCGPFNDIERAKAILPAVMSQLPAGRTVADLRLQGPEFRALDWAARMGNQDVVQWFCEDERLKGCLKVGAAIGWACYTNHVDVAKLLLRHGASPTATDTVLFGNKPPLFMAAEAGRLLALQWLVDEVGQDINMVSPVHGNVIRAIKDPLRASGVFPPEHKKCLEWALARGARE